jgi:hypothetical protein
MKKAIIYFFILFSNYILYSQQNDILNSAKFVFHKPVVTEFRKNLESQLNILYKLNIADKLYIINSLGNRILRFNDEPLSKTDTSATENDFIKLLRGIDTLKNIKRIILLTIDEESAMFYNYAFIETQDNCLCNRDYGRDTIASKPCNIKSLNTLLNYLKKNPIPAKEYYPLLSSDKVFKIYEITKDSIYANQFFDIMEYDPFLRPLIY